MAQSNNCCVDASFDIKMHRLVNPWDHFGSCWINRVCKARCFLHVIGICLQGPKCTHKWYRIEYPTWSHFLVHSSKTKAFFIVMWGRLTLLITFPLISGGLSVFFASFLLSGDLWMMCSTISKDFSHFLFTVHCVIHEALHRITSHLLPEAQPQVECFLFSLTFCQH